MKLGKIIAEKEENKRIFSIDKNKNIKEAAQHMRLHNTSALLVTETKNNHIEYIGILCDSDILSAICETDDISSVKVSDIMTEKMIVATVNDNVNYVMQIMIRHNIRHIPVLEQNKIAAVISMVDIIKALYTEDETKIRYYGEYIGGTHGGTIF
jgi:signal-transduction protein with cAMP-binding, CBS, and nucleotidyltransferase domain